MGRGDDDDDEAVASNITRYPCMPSLVALQQMKNRLHLAYVGKKLMKWTALATGRELRKIALEICITYASFREDMADAFMMLARSRYFCPTMNQKVLQNVGDNAAVKVRVQGKSISGVKVPHMEILDSSIDPNAHLGIDRGGQSILEAKQTWRELLKRLILMLEYRYSFTAVDLAHKSATKRQNTLAKLVIPRCKITITYILAQMEEFSRENFYRMKMLIAVKRKKKQEVVEPPVVCPICLRSKSKREEPTIRCYGCGVYLHLDGISTTIEDGTVDDEDKLLEFRMRLDQIVDITKQIEGRSEIKSLQEFLQNIEGLKTKLNEPIKNVYLNPLPPDVPLDRLCGLCLERFHREQNGPVKPADDAAKLDPKAVDEKASKITVKSAKTTEPLCVRHSTFADLELGTFEFETEEITKVFRVRNEDGSVSEQRKVIRLKKERHTPLPDKVAPSEQISKTSVKKLSDESDDAPSCTRHKMCRESEMNDSLQRSGSSSSKSSKSGKQKRTVGLVTVKDAKKKNLWRSQSEALTSSQKMADPIIRTSESSASILTLLNLINSMPSDVARSISGKSGNTLTSSANYEEMVKLQESYNSQVIPINISFHRNNSLNDSENNLLRNLVDCKFKMKSKSDTDVKLRADQNSTLKCSLSLNMSDSKNYDAK